ncbi:intermembrane phospholipid transport protein YdbH family protein [Marinobacter changyiensis]|uniref:intermembrane phospholipid transport protein YdbH family protein n=1 Tax=Marinobacter changyiensis TaxID=2604091 RepID=UPI0012658B88|nr:YdbH domain-containing protein [Marinobacter changyiensis]
MSRRRTIGFVMLVSVILAVMAGGIYLRQIWQQFMHTHGVQIVEWEDLDLSFSGLTIERLEVLQVQRERQLRVEASALSLDWQWQWRGPQLTSLSLDTLHIDRQTGNDTAANPDPSESLELPQIPLRWLPYDLTISAFHATVPCATGKCDLDGALSATRGPDVLPVVASLDFEHEGHRVQIESRLAGQSSEQFRLNATLAIDGKSHMELQSDYWTASEDQQTDWRGSVVMPELPRADWLLAWLQDWHPISVSDLPPQPDRASMRASWALTGPAGSGFFQSLSGDLTVSANLPQPWLLPGIGAAQGRIELELETTGGHWQAKAAEADLQLQDPGSWARQLPEFLRPDTLELKIRPAEAMPGILQSERFLALNLAMVSRGQARVDINSHLAVAMNGPWALEIGQTRINASTPDLKAGGWVFRDIAAGISVSGHMDEDELALVLGPTSSLEIRAMTKPGVDSTLQLQRVQADFSQLSVTAGFSVEDNALERLSVKGPLSLASAEVSQPLLRPQSWRFAGVLDSGLESGARNFNMEGKLSSKAGASANIDLAYPFGGDLTMTGTLVMDGETSTTALADTLAIWPQSLRITSGLVRANTNFRLPSAGPTELDALVTMEAVSGVIDRTAWTALDGDFDVGLRGPQLVIEVPELTLEQINPGVAIGPVQLGGSYRGSTNNSGSGELKLDRATADFLGGALEVSPSTWSLANLPLQVPLELSKVELSELMRVYPAEGLAGTGTLTGQVPLLIGREGIRIEQGTVTAIKPGGTLRLPADRLRGIAQNNQAMELVAGAMENFHYSVLNSTIDYDQDGRLFLGLHLEGSNPDIQDGHPIVLNINLEEDIPALLTSLQLSGRVNEAVTERVRELMQKREGGQGDPKAED